jgi:O-antigen/teichoic acid export membrane protein
MLARLKQLQKRRFVQRLTVLTSGFFAGQVVVLLASPLLTRLFTPAEFGVYSVFTALNGIFTACLSLRYELAIPIARSDEDAAALTGVAATAVVLACLASLPVIWLVGPWLARITEMPLLAGALWLLPLVVVIHSLGETVSYWSIYRGTFRLNAFGRMLQGVAQSAVQLALGLLGYHAWGLLLGFIFGCAARLAHLIQGLTGSDRRLISRTSPAEMRRLARRHWHYPAFSAPSGLLEAGTQLMPPLLLAVMFGPAVAGWFGLGQRLMSLPIRLLSQAARQVFLGEAAQRDPRGLSRLFMRSSAMFLGLAVLGMTPVLLAGPWLFEVCFGPAWRTAGEMVQLLVPLYITRFVVTPVSQTLNVLGRQNLHLISSSLDAGLLVISFTLAWWLEFPVLSTVALFSACSTFAYLVYFYLAWKSVRAAVARMPRPQEPTPARASATLAD